jgi:hypothetical protein
MMARYYQANLGRFMAVDPGKDTDLENPQSWNKYTYVRNRSIVGRDPDGREIVIENEAGGVQFRTIGLMSMTSPLLHDELYAHACENCPYLKFGGEERGLSEDGLPVDALTDGFTDDNTGEYLGSRIRTNPDTLWNIELRRTLTHEMGHVHDFRTNTQQAMADQAAGKKGRLAKEGRARAFERAVRKEWREWKRESKDLKTLLEHFNRTPHIARTR